MKIVLQYTTGAFGMEIPESAWRTAKGHYTKVQTAKAALDQARAEMRERCGPTAWDCHYQLINAGQLPIQLKATWICQGWTAPDPVLGIHSFCEPGAAEEVVYYWEPGERMPRAPRPEGWDSLQCPACQAKERAAIRREDELTRRGYD